MTCSRIHSDRGTAIVESAVTLLFFFVTLFAIMELGRFFNVQQVVTNAAREGARLSVAPISRTSVLASTEEIEEHVRSFLESARIGEAEIQVERPVTVMSGGVPNEFTRVTVTVPYRVITLTGFFAAAEIDLRGSALMRNETSP